ncbi:MAG: response regulator transcription factor [Planctomycetes bacterium]|nr:response regulator transcription factor [Planctomycetota bacterium]
MNAGQKHGAIVRKTRFSLDIVLQPIGAEPPSFGHDREFTMAEHRRNTVYVVDDDPAMRHSLTRLLESVGLTAHAYATAAEFLADYDPDASACLILDVRLPGMSGVELHEHLRAEGSVIPIIMLTGHAEVPVAVNAIKHGVFEFLEKPISDEVLLRRIHAALALGATSREEMRQVRRFEERMARLTPRERDVLNRMVMGRSTKEMARDLDLSPKTVHVHRSRVFKKLEVDSIVEIARLHDAVSRRGRR